MDRFVAAPLRNRFVLSQERMWRERGNIPEVFMTKVASLSALSAGNARATIAIARTSLSLRRANISAPHIVKLPSN
jgi:hypothetical protein